MFAVVFVGCHEAAQNRLMSAVMANDPAQIETLLNDPKVDVNWRAPRSGDNALTWAAGNDRFAIVSLLLRRGADPNIATDQNEAPLQMAAYFGYAGVVKLLIDAGANVNAAEMQYGMTPLARAARNGQMEVIRLLLDAGADRDARIKDGRNAMVLARDHRHPEAADLISSYQPGASDRGVGR